MSRLDVAGNDSLKLLNREQVAKCCNYSALRFLAALVFLSCGVIAGKASGATFVEDGKTLVMSNGNVRVIYDLSSGRADFVWRNERKIAGFYASVRLGKSVSSFDYLKRRWSKVGSNEVMVSSSGGDLPVLKQYFRLDRENSFLTRVVIESSGTNSNWMAPVVVDRDGGVDIGVANDNRALCVPFDNDHFIRYNAASINSTNKSFEVAAFYDDVTRHGLVVGSVTHDTWKTGITFAGANDKLNRLAVFGGITDPNVTWDVLPHGSVMGRVISSPTIFVGFSEDWRDGMESFADANAAIVPKMSWTNGVPFGWNSWWAFRGDIHYTNAIAVSDFIHTNLQPHGFSNNGTVYINLDSFWNNFTEQQLVEFVQHCHNNSQKAGIYWCPFASWSGVASISNAVVRGTPYHISDIVLRTPDGKLQINDGGIALDPTHPGTKARMNYSLDHFVRLGFDYLKLDFLSHGALEGVHYDTNVTTGIQAYNEGMRYVVDRLGGRMFLSLSIAPIFPYQYGHARRVACDTAGSIGDTGYETQSLNYGWWLSGRLYEYNDPDMMRFEGATLNENKARLVSGAISGTVFLDSDDLGSPAGQELASHWLTNSAINDVARAGRTFRPVEGNTGRKAGDVFVRRDGKSWCVAVFNFGDKTVERRIDLRRVGINGKWRAVDLFSGKAQTAESWMKVELNASDATLVRFVPR